MLSKFNGSTGAALGAFNSGYLPYTYSDATGLGLRNAVAPTGTWTVITDSLTTNNHWLNAFWNASTPTGTQVTVRVCSSADNLVWSSWETAASGSPLSATPDGRYLKVEATLKINSGNVSPILYDLTINAGAPSIAVVKSVGKSAGGPWDDANSAPGLVVLTDSDIYFQFIVTNNGSANLSGLVLTDSEYNASSTPSFSPVPPASMAPGDTYTYIYGPVKAIAGQNTNTATVTGTPDVQATDPANYDGELGAPPVPELPAGLLFGLGIAGVGGFILIKRRVRRITVK